MITRICTQATRHTNSHNIIRPFQRAAFSNTPSSHARDPQTDLLEALSNTSHPSQPTGSSPRDSSLPTNDRNPLLNQHPRERNSGAAMMIDTLQAIANPGPGNNPHRQRMRDRARVDHDKKTVRALEMRMTRRFKEGDVYSPHDLSPAMQRRGGGVRGPRRSSGERDYLDEFALDIRGEYKNMAMMSEFVNETGQIQRRGLTGLRMVNQRRMGKAVRRAVAFGLMPSVHKHPETMHERRTQLGMPVL